ncbi:MAG: deoxyguanosinetriphosphate triphosphohydrolase [Gammaproteobacteria bacterium]|nr:deoxyguanosinetriphosphate triphosphohydrolase [Gammaproteobacteria bacterium]
MRVTPARLPTSAGVQDLAPYACRDDRTRGRRYPEAAPAYRGEFQRDRDRIVHSAAFRRLEYKTQVFVNHEGDMFRTRLTHSIEVAQISRTMARILRLNEDLCEGVALAHDLGHTPFGHAGQDALNACMAEHGGFEHNLQSLRVVDVLEEKYAEFPGLNLTFEAREGILKHCARSKAAALGDVGERFLTGAQPSLEAQVTNLADEVAYNSHDVDDGLRAGLITVEQLRETALFREIHDEVQGRWPGLSLRKAIHEVIRRMIHRQVVDLVEATAAAVAERSPPEVDSVRAAGEPLVRFGPEMRERHLELKRFLHEHLYRHYRVHRMTLKARRIVRELFEAFMADRRILPPDFQAHVRVLEEREGPSGVARGVADYVAGMTDRFAIREHARIYQPAELT